MDKRLLLNEYKLLLVVIETEFPHWKAMIGLIKLFIDAIQAERPDPEYIQGLIDRMTLEIDLNANFNLN